MNTYPRINDKVILMEDFRGSDDYSRLCYDDDLKKHLDALIGKKSTVIGVSKDFFSDETSEGYCDITDGTIHFRIRLKWFWANTDSEAEEKQI